MDKKYGDYHNQADPKTLQNNDVGYYGLCLLYRTKSDAQKYPQTGAAKLVEFLKILEQMPQAPRAVFYDPFGEMNMLNSPHLQHLDMEKVHSTEQLERIWHRKLGGIKTGFKYYWLATRYNPVDPCPMPKELEIPEFEEILQRKKCYAG